MRHLFSVLRDTWNRYSEDHGDLLAAAVAFYSLLSLAPLSVIAIGVASLVFDREQVRAMLLHQIHDVPNADVARVLLRLLDFTAHGGGGIATLIAVGTLVWAASRLFLVIQEALNVIWGVRVAAAKSTRETLRRTALRRVASLLMVLGSGVMLIALLLVQTLITGVGELVVRVVPVRPVIDVLHLAQQGGASLFVLIMLCALVYRVLPDASIRWRDVAVGSAITALLVFGGMELFGLYFSRVAPVWLQGAVGSIAVFMFWLYYNAQVFLVGAAFTRAWACRSGVPVTPTANAELRPHTNERAR
jgi:membrane protein